MYTVTLRDTTTGEIRDCPLKDCTWGETEEDRDASAYWWSEGNMSCDCNRLLYFSNRTERADHCSDGRFVVEKITLPDGAVVYSENPAQKAAA